MNSGYEGEASLQLAVQAAKVGLWDRNLLTNQVTYSAEWKRQLGYGADEISCDLREWECRVHPDDWPRIKERIEAYLANPWPDCEEEFRMRHRDGTWRWILSQIGLIRDDQGRPVRMVGCHTDITRQKQLQIELRRINRASRMIRTLNLALVHLTDETAVLSEICRIAVEVGGYRMAWTGLVSQEKPETICRVAHAGSEGYLESAADVWSDSSPEKAVIRTGQPCIVRNISTDRYFKSRWDAAAERGYQSFIALPLAAEGHIFGHFSIYAGESDAFDTEEVKILRELADDLAFGLEVLKEREERKRAEETLRAKERDLAEAQRVARIGNWRFNVQTNSVSWSEELYRIFGFENSDFPGTHKAFLDRVHPDDRDRVAQVNRNVLASGQPFEVEYRIVLPAGDIRTIRELGHANADKDGKITSLFGTAQDITERKRVEKALLLFRALIDHATDGIEVIDPDSGRFLDVNEKACEEHGYSREEYLQLTVFDLEAKIDLSGNKWRDATDELRRIGIKLIEGAHRRKDGSIFPIEIKVAYVRLDRGYLVAMIHDITERKRAEEALRQTQAELARGARRMIVGELTASIAHEINQPLAAVVTNAAACLRWLDGKTPNFDEARTALQRIIRDGNRAGEVVARTRALLKNGASTKTCFHPEELIKDIVALTEDEIRRRSVRLHTEIAEALPSITADRVQLQQVLLNLVMNSLDALSEVAERPRLLYLRLNRASNGMIRIAVKDSGPGVDLDQQERIFDAFYTTKAHGLGLGLSISRSIVETHGGSLQTAPNDGPGITFLITLPAGCDNAT